MAYNTLLYEVREGVAHLTFNRPGAANAFDMELARELMDAAIACDEDPAVRAVLITGAGRFFSAGGDLKYFSTLEEARIGATFKELVTFVHGASTRLARMDAPLVAAVNGPAAGAGMSFAIAADLVIAAESASFSMAYTAAGLSPDGSSTWFLPRLVGLRRAQELMLTNRRLDAQEALEWGLVNRVVPDAALGEEAGALAATLAAGPTRAYGAVKAMLVESFDSSLEAQLEREGRTIARLAASADGREGVAAFAAKRTPRFTGQ